MAKKITGKQIILANRLDDGRAVFMTKASVWSHDAESAWVVETPAGYEAALEIAKSAVAANLVVDPVLVPASEDGPTHLKQRIQATGPTVRLDLGYQTEGKAA